MISRFTPKYSILVVGKEGGILHVLHDMYKSSNMLSAHLYIYFSIAFIQSKVGARMIDAEFTLSNYARVKYFITTQNK